MKMRGMAIASAVVFSLGQLLDPAPGNAADTPAAEVAGGRAVPGSAPTILDAKPRPRPGHWLEARKVPVGTVIALTDGGSADSASETAGGRWKSLFPAGNIPFESDVSLQLTNGDVMIHEYGTPYWWGLHPNNKGDYFKGTLTKLAEMPNSYAPVYECTTVLADGRVMIYGGEYLAVINEQAQTTSYPDVETNQGAIYDPVANTWATLPAIPQPVLTVAGVDYAITPFGGDNSCMVMPNGKVIVASVGFNYTSTFEAFYSSFLAILDPATLTWEVKSPPGLDAGNAENNWTLLPDGTLFTVDASYGLGHRYLAPWIDGTTDGEWIDAGTPPVTLQSPAVEMGPGVLRPDGSVLVIGATANTAVYQPPDKLRGTGTWSSSDGLVDASGNAIGACDGAASLLPSGDVLVGGAAGCYYTNSVTFSSVDGTTPTILRNQPGFDSTSVTFAINNMLLPTGAVLVQGQTNVVDPAYTGLAAGDDYPVAEVFIPRRKEREQPPRWAPSITSMPGDVKPGATITVAGKRINGVSQGSYYGDDGSSFTNYPLVRVTNVETREVTYWRTHNHSSMGVSSGRASTEAKVTNTQVDVPPDAREGWYELEVVANGVASWPQTIRVDDKSGGWGR
jgi:hypothetical protein